ncbi:MAG: hypothetical protein DRP87_12150 [Spirochaetes bacterium]|nr:MAG: hypothetical protein DRP87_12150 [Spirochaetota bacterium]
MEYYLKLAWRNIFRNRRRTFLTGLIIAIGLAMIMFMDGMIVGMKNNIISSGTSSFLGDAQIHRVGFNESQDTALTINRLEELKEALLKDESISVLTERVLSFATLSSPADINSIVICGVDPRKEKFLSKMDEGLIEGSYVSKEGDIMIGDKLAERLEVESGDRVILTLSEAGSGELIQEMFRVSGIYRIHIEEMDASMAFIVLSQAQKLLGIENEIHEIAVQFKDFKYAIENEKTFEQKYSEYGNIAETWPSLIPQLKYIIDMTDISIGLLVLLVFAVIVFGIINTLFMSLYERTFEFGVLRAVGTRPGGLRKLIVFEAGSLAVYSIIIGIVIGTALNLFGSLVGMDLTGVELAGTTFTSRIYTAFKARQYILHPLLIFAFTVLVSFYPANHAAKMSITDALRKTM